MGNKFTELTGTAAQNAQLRLARHCVDLEAEAGAVNVPHVVKSLNSEFRLVDEDKVDKLANDVSRAYDFISNQETESVNRAGYWKFKATTAANNLKDSLVSDLGLDPKPKPQN